MDDKQFDALAEATLARIESALEASDADLDFERIGDNILEISFADGSKIVINRHDAAQEMWIAAKAGGFHYRWNGSVWQDTRQDEEMTAALARLISLQAKENVSLP